MSVKALIFSINFSNKKENQWKKYKSWVMCFDDDDRRGINLVSEGKKISDKRTQTQIHWLDIHEQKSLPEMCAWSCRKLYEIPFYFMCIFMIRNFSLPHQNDVLLCLLFDWHALNQIAQVVILFIFWSRCKFFCLLLTSEAEVLNYTTNIILFYYW